MVKVDMLHRPVSSLEHFYLQMSLWYDVKLYNSDTVPLIQRWVAKNSSIMDFARPTHTLQDDRVETLTD